MPAHVLCDTYRIGIDRGRPVYIFIDLNQPHHVIRMSRGLVYFAARVTGINQSVSAVEDLITAFT